MIKSINIQGFRGIDSLLIDDFKQINILLGKNNCGKTSILESLFLIIGITNPKLTHSIHIFRELLLTQTDDFRYIFPELDFYSKVKIEATTVHGQTRSLEIEPVFLSSSSSKKELQVVDANGASTSSTALGVAGENVEKLVLNSVIREGKNGKPKKFKSEISIENSNQQITIPRNYKESMTGFFINSNTLFSDLNTRIENILVRKEKDMLLEPIQDIEPQIRDIIIGTKGMIYLDLGFRRMMPINLLGDGIKRVIAILAKILDTKNGIILIDEIENGLHFSSLKLFLKYLIRVAKLQNVQLFISTHNKETLKNLKEVLNVEEICDPLPEICTFTIRKHTNGKIISYPYDIEKLKHAIEQDIEIR